MSSKFKRKIEDFICENCTTAIKGDGFTNHCSRCLYSKHVDVFPGDRAENCGGLMKPISALENGGEWSIIQQCQKCGKQQKNKISKDDDFEEVVKISKENQNLD